MAPTVQKVTHGIRKIAQAFFQNRKKKKQTSLAAESDTAAPLKSRPLANDETMESKRLNSASAKRSTAKKSQKLSASPTQGQKAKTEKRAPSARIAKRHNLDVIPETNTDPAHQPGHRKMNLESEFSEKTGTKSKPQNSKALNFHSGSDKVKKTTSPHRRLINGSGTLGAKAPQSRSRKAH